MKRIMFYVILCCVAVLCLAFDGAVKAMDAPVAQTNPIEQCFDGINDITDITLDDLLACVEVLRDIGEEILAWLLDLIKDIIDHFFGDGDNGGGL